MDPATPLPARIDAVLFDLDGTLVESEDWHMESTVRMLAGMGVAVSGSDLRRFLGWAEEPYYLELKRLYGIPGDPQSLSQQRAAEFQQLLHEVSIEPLPGVLHTLQQLERLAVPCAVASSSVRTVIAATLEAAGLDARIHAVRSGHDDVDHGKPAADVYHSAAAAVGVEARHCVAVEDSPTGLAAAHASGAFTVLVPNLRLSGNLPPADLTLPTLDGFAELLARR